MSHVQNPRQRGNLNLPTIKHPPSTMLLLDCERHLHYTPSELKLKLATNKEPLIVEENFDIHTWPESP